MSRDRQEAEQTAGVRIEPGRAYGFFTDTTRCIGCKACEVACKEWNQLPAEGEGMSGMSYDNTRDLSATTWRHVAFIEQMDPGMDGELPAFQSRWPMMSDVCKHCDPAPCLEACPTGAIFRTEFDTVVVQQDICNGCGYCVPACPFGVVDLDDHDGKTHKCTLCYDRLKGGMEPACKGLSDGFDPVRRPGRARGARSPAGRGPARARGRGCLSLWRPRQPRRDRRHRSAERVLPAARPARGLQLPGRAEPASRADRSRPRHRPRGVRRARRRCRGTSREPAMSRRERAWPEPGSSVGYYGLPPLKSPHWDWKVSGYIAIAGVSGAAQALAWLGRLRDPRRFRGALRNARWLALAGTAAGTALLIADLKTPRRFYNMLRILRPTSPMSFGSYVLGAFGACSAVAALGELPAARRRPGLSRVADVTQAGAGTSGAGAATYTAALLSATSTPYWAAAPGALGA